MNQQDTARELGYGDDIDAMNAEHDSIHKIICSALGIHSYSMDVADGLHLSHAEYCLANVEEDAILACQKLLQQHRVFLH